MAAAKQQCRAPELLAAREADALSELLYERQLSHHLGRCGPCNVGAPCSVTPRQQQHDQQAGTLCKQDHRSPPSFSSWPRWQTRPPRLQASLSQKPVASQASGWGHRNCNKSEPLETWEYCHKSRTGTGQTKPRWKLMAQPMTLAPTLLQ